MKRQFAELLEDNTPKANPTIMEGLATRVIPYIQQFIDSNFRSISRSFPKGLRYIGCERCSTEEEFTVATKSKSNKKTYELSESSMFLVKYKFSYFDQDLDPVYLYVPFVQDAGLLYLRGSLSHISPVLTDKIISPDKSNLFVRLIKVKLIFERTNHTYVRDGKNDYVFVTYSDIYKPSKSDKSKNSSKANTTVLHYLFCKYGFTETFKRYLGFVPVVGEDEINISNYPEKDWVICKSTGIIPEKYSSNSKFYQPSKIRVAVPRVKWNSEVQNIIGNFFYIVDFFPSIKVDWLDSTSRWMYLMGCIIFSPEQGVSRLNERIEEHMNSLDNYLDDIVKEKIVELGYSIETFYDLIFIVLRDFDKFINVLSKNKNNLYERNFEILYYIIMPLIKNFVKMYYEINKKINKKGGDKPLDFKSMNKTIGKFFKMNALISINHNNKCVTNVNYSGDNKYPKLTAICGVQQSSDTNGSTRGSKSRGAPNSSKHLHVSAIEIGSLLGLSKSNPAPAYRTNMFVNVSIPDGKIIRNEETRALLDSVQEDFGRRTELSPDELIDVMIDVEDDMDSDFSD